MLEKILTLFYRRYESFFYRQEAGSKRTPAISCLFWAFLTLQVFLLKGLTRKYCEKSPESGSSGEKKNFALPNFTQVTHFKNQNSWLYKPV